MSLLSDFSDDVTCLSFHFLKGIGPKYGHDVINRISRGDGTIDNYVDAVLGVGRMGPSFSHEAARNALHAARSEIEKAEVLDIRVIPVSSSMYPVNLAAISGAPLTLFMLGDADAMNRGRRVAIVGTRQPSVRGSEFCRRITRTLVEGGVTIVSGLALGCDSIAHGACLKTGGITVAVMPCGLDITVPASNRSLSREITLSGGALVSEYPLGIKPRKGNYVQRNRIQSGLSDAVIIVEAALNSGTMETAKRCLEQGRPLYSVSPVTLGEDANSDGNRKLIEDGARVLENRDDVMGLIRDLGNKVPNGTILGIG